MRVMAPLDIVYPTGGRLIASSAPISDYVAWAGATSYTAPATPSTPPTSTTYCYSAGRDFRCILAHTNKEPYVASDWETYWQDLGVSNIWKQFDMTANTASVAASPLVNVLSMGAGVRVTGLAIFGVVGSSVHLEGYDGATLVYDETIDLSYRYTTTWLEYLYGDFLSRQNAIFYNLPVNYANLTLVLTVTNASGDVSVETVAVGTPVELGSIHYGANSDVLDFSGITRDAFGNATLVPRKSVPLLSVQMNMTKPQAARAHVLRRQLAGRPAIWAGIEETDDEFFDLTSMIGIFKRMPIVIQYEDRALASIEIEGL